jgi:N-acetyl sugar amidotransferase
MYKNTSYQICTRGVWDSSVPGITFDSNGVSNYVKIHEMLESQYPQGAEGKKIWNGMVKRMKAAGANKKYDCLVGISGGTDSCYLLHLAREAGLRPLAVNIDNGWNTEIAEENIKKIVSALNVDFKTYRVNKNEMNDILFSYMKASLPWVDSPSDKLIKAMIYILTAKANVRYVLSGGNFRSEGKQPSEWTYSDTRQQRYLHRRFGNCPLKTYPVFGPDKVLFYGFIKGIKILSPLNYLDYSKQKAQQLLQKKYGWQYYGGHHHENVFTRFIIGYWLPKKFGIDKRIITLSAQVLSGEIPRDEALEELRQPPYTEEMMEKDKAYVLKKLGISQSEFDSLLKTPNKYFWDYPSNYPLISKYRNVLKPVLKYFLRREPMLFTEVEIRNQNDGT